ncbi:hypothetical protein, partial [Desulfurella sp.]|uniref:hypothetical protein n=1 Tax=Desulfurella sp. TaxID=1962857 RepID=UPI0025BE04B1
MSIEEVNKGITHKDGRVRLEWAIKTNFTPTPEQVEIGLSDTNYLVRIRWARRTDFKPTPEQV